jgi:hypothetical protein
MGETLEVLARVRSPFLNAWLHPRASRLASGAHLLISDDRDGREPWVSNELRARQGEQRARQELEHNLTRQAELEQSCGD